MLLLVVVAVRLGDDDALVLAAIVLVGLVLLVLRRHRLAAVLLGLMFANLLFWSLPGTASNLIHGEETQERVFTISMTVISLAGVVAPVGLVLMKMNPAAGAVAAKVVGLSTLVLLIAGLAFSVMVRIGDKDRPRSGDLMLVSEDTEFSQTEIIVDEGGVGVFMENKDLFWHTFTIDELQFDLAVPVGGERRAVMQARPGTYRFYCRIPGHDLVGMNGTLIVREAS